MAKKFLTGIDLEGNEIINARAENVTANPTSGNAGRIIFNTTNSKMLFDTGAAIVALATETQLGAKADLASPALTGVPTAPTASGGTNTTQLATTAFVQAAVGSAGGGDMLKSVYDSVDDGVVNAARAAPWTGITGKPATFAPSAHNHVASEISDFATAVNTQVAAYWDTIAGGDNNADTIRETLDIILANASAVQDLIGRYNADIGDGSATSFNVTHSLNSLDVTVEVYEKASGDTVEVEVSRVDANTVQIGATPALGNNAYRIVVKR